MATEPEDEPQDDPEVPSTEVLYRHLHPHQWVEDAIGEGRLSSSFMRVEPDQDGLSSYSASLLLLHGFKPEDILPTGRYGYVELTVGAARDLGWGVVPDPDNLLPVNVAHMLIKAPKQQLSRKQRRVLGLALAERVTIVKYPVL